MRAEKESGMRVVTIAIVTLWAATATAQSLGDVARQEAERRKSVKAPGKTYTNDQLKAEPPPSAPAASATQPATGTPAGPAGTPAAGSPGGATGKEGTQASPANGQGAPAAPKAEAEWRAKMQATRDALNRAQIFAEALQSRINGLSADFTARDDPAQRAGVAADRQKSLDELERVKKEIQQHTKALADIQDEGRRAGVPAGWLR
jgi:hypothetical protein